MDEDLKQYLQSLPLGDTEKTYLLNEYKVRQKKIEALEFKFKRTVADKTAITNILNASIEEIKKQKAIIEVAKDEINRNLIEMDAQKKLIEEKNSELNELLSNLRKTQKQLILAEKMASLGELTAGIAHEIQNPLNFVNNFSEVSRELIDELKTLRSTLTSEEQENLLKVLDTNLEKIAHHGKRADAIVKGMLQHSRTSTDQKEPTDINALCDEYIQLSYHGFRAKDKRFNATIHTHFDETMGKINIVAEDIRRVLLNLLNNALYAVSEKRNSPAGLNNGYQPLLTIVTKRAYDVVEIKISDNGNGIPSGVIDKIFQPFFTTKPTGRGTGLGLSLSYDSIKTHGGTIQVVSKEGEGSTFTIRLPVT